MASERRSTSGGALKVLVVLVDAFVILVVFQLIVWSLADLDAGKRSVIEVLEQRIRELETRETMQLERIAELEEAMPGGKPADDGSTAVVVVTPDGAFVCRESSNTRSERVAAEGLVEWVLARDIDVIELSAEQSVDFQSVLQAAARLRRGAPEAAVYFVGGSRT